MKARHACALGLVMMIGATHSDAAETTDAAVQQRGWSSVRTALAGPDCGLLKRDEYCIRDRDFVDPIVQRLLNKYYGGTIPREAAKLAELTEFAQTNFATALQTADGLRRLEALIRARFATPKITQSDGGVLIDFGLIPGRLSVGPRGRIGINESPHVFSTQWKSIEVAQALAQHTSPHSSAKFVQLDAQILDTQHTRWSYRYERATERVLVFSSNMPTGGYVTTGPVGKDFVEYVTGQKSFAVEQLRWQRQARVMR
jgi:hypothetical protein